VIKLSLIGVVIFYECKQINLNWLTIILLTGNVEIACE